MRMLITLYILHRINFPQITIRAEFHDSQFIDKKMYFRFLQKSGTNEFFLKENKEASCREKRHDKYYRAIRGKLRIASDIF